MPIKMKGTTDCIDKTGLIEETGWVDGGGTKIITQEFEI